MQKYAMMKGNGIGSGGWRNVDIDHYEPRAVIRGLLDGEDFANRVAGSCVYRCPRCGHGIRFRWRSFYQADERSFLRRRFRRRFDDLTPERPPAEQGFLDFHCPTCAAPTRIIFSVQDYTQIGFHFDIYAALVGQGTV